MSEDLHRIHAMLAYRANVRACMERYHYNVRHGWRAMGKPSTSRAFEIYAANEWYWLKQGFKASSVQLSRHLSNHPRYIKGIEIDNRRRS